MEKPKHSVRFEAAVDEHGVVRFAKEVPELGLKPGAAVTVSIFGGVLSRRLKRLGVTEDEIERIGAVQLEDRGHVMSFLSSQGSLKGSKAFRARLSKVVR